MRRPSPGRMLGGAGERLRGAGYVLADVGHALARFPRAIASGGAEFWASMPVIARRRLVAAVGVVAAILIAAWVVVPNLPCQVPGGDRCPPDDEAAGLVPSDAVAYLHANLDADTDQYEAAAELVARTPLVSRQVIGQLLPLLVGAAGAPPDFARDVEPWFGGEVAVAFVGARGRTQQVQLLEAEDEDGALRYVEEIAAGQARPESYRDVEIREDQRGLASAVVDGFLVLGPATAVRDVVDVATEAEGAEPLEDDAVAEEARDELPDHRLAEAYLSSDGLSTLAADRDSSLAAFEPFLDSDASRGAAVALSVEEDGVALASRSVLDAERAESNPGFFAAFDGFEPELPEELPPDTLAYVGLGEPSETAQALLRQATARAPGIARGFTQLVERLQRDAGVNLEADLLPALGGEAAFAVQPREGGEQPEREAGFPGENPPETLPPGAAATPYLELLATDVDEERARDALARLQGPLARSLGTRLGAPVFDQQKIGDVEAHVLRLSPTAQLAYAVFDGRLSAASDPAGVRRAVEGDGGGLDEHGSYQEATDGLADEPGLIAYLDVAGLLRFGERSGLATDTAYAAFAPDLRQLDAFALTVGNEDGRLDADARLRLADPGEDDED